MIEELSAQGHSQDDLSAKPGAHSALLSKNVRIHERRTSVRLEPEMWNALKEIASIEKCSIHDLCGAVHDMKEESTSFTAALRVFLMEYYRSVSKTSLQVGLIQKQIKTLHSLPQSKPAELPQVAAAKISA